MHGVSGLGFWASVSVLWVCIVNRGVSLLYLLNLSPSTATQFKSPYYGYIVNNKVFKQQPRFARMLAKCFGALDGRLEAGATTAKALGLIGFRV